MIPNALDIYTEEDISILRSRKDFKFGSTLYDYIGHIQDQELAAKVVYAIVCRYYEPTKHIIQDERVMDLTLAYICSIDAENRKYISIAKRNRNNGSKHTSQKIKNDKWVNLGSEMKPNEAKLNSESANNFSNDIKITQEKSGLFDSEITDKNSGILVGYDSVNNSQISDNKVISEIVNNTENLGATPEPNQTSEYLGEEMLKNLANCNIYNNNLYNNIDNNNIDNNNIYNNNIDNIYIYGKNKNFSQNFSEKNSVSGNDANKPLVNTNLFGEVEVAPSETTKQAKKTRAKAGSVRKVKAKEGQEIDFAKLKEFWNKLATEAQKNDGLPVPTMRKDIPIWLQDQVQEVANDFTTDKESGKKAISETISIIFAKLRFYIGDNNDKWTMTFRWLFEKDGKGEYPNFEKMYEKAEPYRKKKSEIVQITDEEKYKDEHPLEYAIANGLPELLVPIASKMGYDAVCIVDPAVKWISLKNLDSVCALSTEEQRLIYQFKESRNEL